MIRIWRICKSPHARSAFSGVGARMFGGRWNHPGTAVVYCSATLSLATLELFVHLDPGDAPDDLVAIAADVPDDVAIERLDRANLPSQWREEPGPAALRDLGDAWAASRRTALLEVPSTIVPTESNYVINPAHADAASLVIARPQPYRLDPRLWKSSTP